MSFILDALKKSENERQRQSGPGLFEAKVAVPKARWPGWAFALTGLLVVNIGVVCWLTLRQPSRAAAANATPTPAALPAPQTAPTATSAASPAESVPPPATMQQPAPSAETTPPPATAESNTEELNSDDYEPAKPSASMLPAAAESHVTRGTAEGLPTYDQVAGTPSSHGLPDLRLDLHVYAAKPQDRFIFLNMHRLREGDALPEGVRVEAITPDGAILSFHGTKFVFDRD